MRTSRSASRVRRSAITSVFPFNDAARLRADTWDASLLTMPEHQCKPHPSDYAWRGPANLRVWKEVDRESQKLVAYHTHISWQAPERTIWMDGRPHPPDYAAHTWQGFSTGKFEGDMLTITTTHLKNGWIRRNGIPRSDRATVTEHMIRHGNFMTVVVVIDDPVYLTEPFVRTTDFEYDCAPGDCTVSVRSGSGSNPPQGARCQAICRGRISSSPSSRSASGYRWNRRAAGPKRCIRNTG